MEVLRQERQPLGCLYCCCYLRTSALESRLTLCLLLLQTALYNSLASSLLNCFSSSFYVYLPLAQKKNASAKYTRVHKNSINMIMKCIDFDEIFSIIAMRKMTITNKIVLSLYIFKSEKDISMSP